MGYVANFAFFIALQGKQRTVWTVTPHRRGDNTFHYVAPAAATVFVYWLIKNHYPWALHGITHLSVLPEIQQTLSRHHWSVTTLFGHGAPSLPATPVPLRTTCFKEKMAFLVLWRLWADSCSGLVPGKSVFAACSSFTGIHGSVGWGLVCGWHPCLWQRGWNWINFKISSNPNHSLFLLFYIMQNTGGALLAANLVFFPLESWGFRNIYSTKFSNNLLRD